MIRKYRLRFVAGAIATVILLGASAEAIWSSFERSKEANASVEHTYHVLISGERFLSTIRDTESSLRGYVITHNRRFLVPYDADLQAQARIMADLERLTRDNPEQQASLKAIRALAAQRLALLAIAVRAIDDGRFDLLSSMVQSGRGSQIMSELTSRLGEFEEAEHRLLALRTNAAGEAMSRARFLLVFTSLLLAAALLSAGAIAERYIASREVVYEALQRQADLIDFSHDAIITSNPKGQITGWNAGATEIYGWSSAEAMGRPAREILKTEDAGLFTRIDDAIAKTGRWDGELAQTAKDGRTRIVESRYVQVRSRAGAPVGVLNISRDATQRRRAADLLMQVAEQRRLALDAAELGSWDYRVDQDTVTWDERCREIMALPGLGPATFEQALKMVHPDEREAMRAEALHAMSGQGDGRFTHEMRIVLRDGSVRWLATFGRIYFTETNGVKRPTRVIGVNSDITERKRVEEALRDSQDRLRVALDTGRIGIFDDLPLEKRTIFDRRAKQLWGLSPEAELDDSTLSALVHPEDRAKLKAAIAEDHVGSESDAGEIDYRIVRPDGEVRWMIARRRVARVLGILLDITEQKRAEQKLAEALWQSGRERRRLRALLETMPAGILLANHNNDALEVNAEAVRIWRAGSVNGLVDRWREFKGWRAGSGELLRLEDWPGSRALRGETVSGETIDIERFDGSTGTIFNSASPIKDAKGNLQGTVSVIVDITEQRQIEIALRSSEERLRLAHRDLERLLEQKDILFKEVQHRVKNNLQVVSSLLSLEAQRFEDSEFHRALNESRDRIRSMALMHEKFYHLDDLARIEFAEYVEELARYFFSSYIAEPSAIAFTSKVDVRLTMDEAIPCGLILQELLSNSVKHAFPRGSGEIRIAFHSDDGEFELVYWDNGVGLPQKVNLGNPETLGLQLVTDLADQLRGKIRYEYRAGSLFTLTFPAAEVFSAISSR